MAIGTCIYRYMEAQNSTFLLRAVQCELRARDAPDPLMKTEWEEIAIEWHLLANAVAQASGEEDQIDVA